MLTETYLRKYNKNYFAIAPIFYRLFMIGMVLSLYYYMDTKGWFPQWTIEMYYITKVIVAYQIIVGGLRTFVLPGLTLAAGLVCLFAVTAHHTALISAIEVWQWIIVSVVSIVLAIFTQL